MRRSEIKAIMNEPIDFLRQYKFKLPPFGFCYPGGKVEVHLIAIG